MEEGWEKREDKKRMSIRGVHALISRRVSQPLQHTAAANVHWYNSRCSTPGTGSKRAPTKGMPGKARQHMPS